MESTQLNKEAVIESAKYNIKDLEVLDNNIESKALKRKVFKKCKEAIIRCTDFKEIGKYLVQSLNNLKYEWTAFVYQRETGECLVSSFVYKIQLGFGDLYIILFCHYRSDVPSNDSHPFDAFQTQTNKIESKGEVILNCEQLDQLERVRGPDTYALDVKRISLFEWPLERIMKTIRNSIKSFK